jgi:hypothetical protein
LDPVRIVVHATPALAVALADANLYRQTYGEEGVNDQGETRLACPDAAFERPHLESWRHGWPCFSENLPIAGKFKWASCYLHLNALRRRDPFFIIGG